MFIYMVYREQMVRKRDHPGMRLGIFAAEAFRSNNKQNSHDGDDGDWVIGTYISDKWRPCVFCLIDIFVC